VVGDELAVHARKGQVQARFNVEVALVFAHLLLLLLLLARLVVVLQLALAGALLGRHLAEVSTGWVEMRFRRQRLWLGT
jgi:hypothetical protein